MGRPAMEDARHLRWGLSARLPRWWRAFDGRRSLVTVNDGSPAVMATVARRARDKRT